MAAQIIDHISREIELSEEEKNEFLSILSEVFIPKKEFLIVPNQKIENEYYVVEGCLKAYYLDEQGDKHIIQFAIEDWWISDFEAFFKNQPSKLYVEALEDSRLLALDHNSLEILYSRIPKFERFFRLKITNAFVALRERILSSLQKSNTELYLEFCETYPDIEKRVQNYHIANYLGMKPESLSRIRKELT
ncbi:MAG: Crp/Fnr family transcriptional regulator [Christiangramia sp.]